MAIKSGKAKPRRAIRITAGDEEIEVHIGRPGCSEDCTDLNALANALHEAAGAVVEELALGGDGELRSLSGLNHSQVVGDDEAARRQANARQQQAAHQTNG
jgi:hypothetical protein